MPDCWMKPANECKPHVLHGNKIIVIVIVIVIVNSTGDSSFLM